MKKYFLLFGALFTLMVFWLVVTELGRSGKIKITLNVVPAESTLSVDGKVFSGKVVYLPEGGHKFEATFRDFTPAAKDLNIQQPLTLTLSPQPVTQAALDFLAQNPDIQKQRESLGGQAATQAGQTIQQKYPFINQLPIISGGFAIYQSAPQRSNASPDNPAIALDVVALNPLDRARAVERIKSELGIDPSTVEIIFENAPIFAAKQGIEPNEH